MDTAKLERLLIKEVSGVDAPANLLDGWMVQKASSFKTSLPIGPDESWDVSAAEGRVREKTGATDGPTKAYAACFLWYDGSADKNDAGVPANFGDYKFLVVDVVDGKLQVMPQALRAAASRLSGSSLSDSDKTAVQSTLDKLEAKAGIGEAATKAAAPDEDAPSTLEKIRNLLFPARKDEVDMTVEELNAALDEREPALIEKVAEVVIAKSAAPAEGASAGAGTEAPAAAEAPSAEATEQLVETLKASLTESLTESTQEALKPYNEILDATLERIAGIEKALGIVTRKSLDGQENGAGDGTEGTTTTKATFGDALTALAKAHLRGEKVALVGPGQ